MRPRHTRERTLMHMHRMVATATAVGTAAACTKPDTTQGPQTVTIPSATTTTTAPPPPTVPIGTTTATPEPEPTGPPGHGYLVVDMLPAPALCAGIASSTTATTSYQIGKGGALVLRVTVKLGGGATWSGILPSAWGGIFQSHTTNAAKDVIDVYVKPQAPQIGLSIPITCIKGPGTISVSVVGPPTPKPGDKTTVSIYDY
ncbi:hypothetical protein BH09MYX1_BH09MYX1_53400 [soil metagenome]